MQSGTKRQNPRYSIGGKFEGSELPALQTRKKPGVFRGRVQDISDGGVLSACRPATCAVRSSSGFAQACSDAYEGSRGGSSPLGEPPAQGAALQNRPPVCNLIILI